ncbi:MAG: MBL fold metallo-hydrolase [Planctomycetes bacterium]|nr:MBL fold metallo-hydrolase [Planctomycetota bacterium]
MSVATLEMKPIAYGRDCKTYLLYDADTKEAAIIDPRFDHVSRYMTELEKLDLKLKYAFDTHTHADHLSGSDRLRNLTACAIVMSDKTKSKVADYLATDGEKFKLGGHELTVLHTPGHTPDSQCIFDGARVYTGDTLFIGGAARTDFMGGSPEQLFESFRKIEALGKDVEVWPGHDYNGHEHSSIAAELENNDHFKADRETLIGMHKLKGELPANMSEILSFNSEAGLPEARIVKPSDVAAYGTPGKDFTLLDSRYADEFEAGRIEGAVLIPLPELRDRWSEVEKLPHPIVSVCRSGVRATMAMMTARHADDNDWLLLEGGMQAWMNAGQPMVSDTGKAPDVITSKFATGGSCAAGGGSCSVVG